MMISSLAQHSPLKGSRPVKTMVPPPSLDGSGPAETVSLSDRSMRPAPPSLDKADTGKMAKRGHSVLGKVFGGLGLGLVALSLAGCNLGGTPDTPPTPPNNEKPQESTAATYTARMDQLRNSQNKTGYYQMAEAGYNNAVLQNFAKATDPAAKDVAELAKKAVESFNFKGDPAEQQKLTRDVLKAIAEMKGDDAGLVRYTQAAQTTLAIDQAFADGAAQAPAGIIAQVKNAAYEQGFKAALEKIKAAPEQLKNQSGYDPALIRNYIESVSINPQIALDFAPQMNDQSLSSVLYQTTGNALYQRMTTDGSVLGSQVQTALQLLKTLSGK